MDTLKIITDFLTVILVITVTIGVPIALLCVRDYFKKKEWLKWKLSLRSLLHIIQNNPDVLVLFGVFVFAIYQFRIETTININGITLGKSAFGTRSITVTSIEWGKVAGTMLIFLGLDLIARKVFIKNR